MSTASVVAALGAAFTASPGHVLAVFEFVGGGECSEGAVARLLAALVRTKPHGSPDAGVAAQVFKTPLGAAPPPAPQWDADVFVAAVKDRNPNCDWYKVLRGLDAKDFAVFSQDGLSVLLNVFKAAVKDIFKFPISVFFGRWQNVKGQLSFIKQAILSAPELFSFTLLTSRRVLSDQLLMGKSLPTHFVQQHWNNLDLVETLVLLSEVPEALDDVKALFEYAMQTCPELLLIGLAQIPPPWTPLHKEVASTLVIMFLAGNQNSSFVIPLLWQVSPSLVLAGLAHIYSKDPSQIGRILDIVQEIKALSQILDTKHSYFTLDLAVLASRRNYMSLEKWLQDRIQLERAAGSSMFLKGCLEFISDKITAAASSPGAAAFPVDIVATFLRVLRNSPMTPEMAAFFKELLVVSIKVYPHLMGNGGLTNNNNNNNIIMNNNNNNGIRRSHCDRDAEKEANLYYGKLLKGEVSIPQIVDLLRRYRDSTSPREQEVFAQFTQVHLDEYKFFPQYPDKQLQVTSMLFGALIQDVYVDAKNLANSLRCVLEALRQPIGSKFFKFGSLALMQFQLRLEEWPHYCSLLMQIPHLQQANPEIIAYVTPFATSQEGGDTAGPGNGDLKNATGGRQQQQAAAGSSKQQQQLDAEATDQDAAEPDDTIKDKILFIINNLTFDNLEEKVEEMKEVLVDEHFRWFSEYLVVKRTSIEPNFHELYIALLESLSFPAGLLNADKTVTSSSERTLLKNLGTWLGSITLAKNRPIKHKNLAFKSLLLEGFESDRLIVVIPFVCKVLEQSHDSKVFKPPNPWLMAIMKLLSELYNYADLKLNLKFEIEVLCKKIQLDIKDIEPAIILRNRPNKLNLGQKKSGEALGLPNPATLTQPNEEGLYPISVYITLPNLPIFSSQPSIKRIVHLAIDRAIREVVVSPVVERSVTIAGIATRELIVKDFALEPDEIKMRKAAHLMAQNLAGSLAIVSSRDPLRIGMITQLQNLLRQNGFTEQAVSEQVVFMIVSDNLDLACSVMERAAAEKSVAEIDESLTAAYLNRRKHRERSSQPYYDVNVYAASRYPSSLPEPLRLKTNGLTPAQYRVYEDFSRIARHAPAGTEGPIERDGRGGAREGNVEDQIPAGVIQAMEKLDAALVELDKAIASTMTDSITQLPAQHEIKIVLRQISAFITQFNRDDIHLVAGQKVVAQLFRIDLPLSRECYVLLLERIFDISKVAAKEIISWFLYAADERRWNVDVIVIMIRANMMPMHDLDVQLARLLDSCSGKEEVVQFVVDLIRAVLLGEAPFAAHDAFFNSIAMLRDRVVGTESVTALLRDVKSRFSVVSLKGPNGKDLESVELRESLGVLFSEWVKIYHHPSSSEKTHKEYILQRLAELFPTAADLGVLQEEDISSMFFRVCTELSVDLYIQAKSAPNVSPLLPFQAVDAFARLIVLLVRYHAESAGANGNAAKLDLTTKILYIIVLVLVHSHEQRRGQFNQRPFFRLFSSLLNDLNLFEDELQAVYYQILFKIIDFASLLYAEAVVCLKHRRLLVDLFKFLGPFLRQSEMADAIRLLYKATLRILLVLDPTFLHPAQEFDFECLPRNMRLPDPFTPNLKVELLPEINQAPHVMSDYTSSLNQINLKAELDAFLKNPNPQPDDVTKYNSQAINSLVLYVGVQAIAQQQAKGTTAASSSTAPAPSASLDIFQQLIADFDSEGRYLLLSAIANQLRYPNSHTHYFSNILLHMFAEASEEIIQEQITRVLIERLIVNRPHPYGLLITFIDLIRNQRFNFWEHTNFIRCAPEIERLFQSVYKSIQSSMLRA
ncbi:CCR4-Not complex component, Not1-domain-containing protein [Obelidium mucronatum]|nr:CCR4-Not complex component, Not1-domain-containing protein [Obelidium mucronatum]